MDRRELLKLGATAGGWWAFRRFGQAASATLEPWTPGTLDFHHLAYGRGNSTFVLGPDGTTMLIDAGTNHDSLDVSCAQRPHASVRPGEWIAGYVLRQMKAARRADLDYALVTHIHPDHVGDPGPECPKSGKGDYRLTGLMDVDARVPIGTLIDRGYPDYEYPAAMTAPFALNYLAYVKSRERLGQRTEELRVGSAEQIRLVGDRARYPGFAVRNLAANGEVWTGAGKQTRKCSPELASLKSAEYPTENMCSAAVRMEYGKFRYFTGGDLTADTEETGEAWRDIETPVARAAGPVDVAVADHHGYFDAVGPEFVKALRPRAFVIPAWYVAHPGTLQLRRMLSRQLYPGDRDVYETCSMEANRLVNHQFIGQVKSLEGQVIVRVAPGGDEFRVIVTDNSDDEDRVKMVAGPFSCTRKASAP
jgi:beta-lactamase superfamily II metal-dependent hydrolase